MKAGRRSLHSELLILRRSEIKQVAGIFLVATVLEGLTLAVEPKLLPEGEITITFQNDDDYQFATDDAKGNRLKPSVDTKNNLGNSHLIRFGALSDGVRGEGVEIIEAKLLLYYYDEWWTKLVYHIGVAPSLDGTVENLGEPDSTVQIYGDRWEPGKKTPLPGLSSRSSQIPCRSGSTKSRTGDL